MRFQSLLIVFLAGTFTCASQVMNVRKWRQSERDSLDNALNLVDEAYYERAFPYFEHLLLGHPDEPFLKYSYAKCALYRGDRNHESQAIFNGIYSKIRKIPDVQFDMARAAFYRHKYDEAEQLLKEFLSNKKTRADGRLDAERLQRYITNARYFSRQKTGAVLSVMGQAINSEFEEYAPAVTADGSVLFYTYAGPKSRGGLQPEDLGEDIRNYAPLSDVFYSRKEDHLFQPAVPVDSINTIAPEFITSVSTDGRALLMFQDVGDGHGDIYLSTFNGIQFSEPQPLRGEVNTYARESHAALSPDGKTLYFTSDRTGGYGGMDIYRASLSADSSWVNIRNLGDSVNTIFDEESPFMHADGLSLFFSSRGRTSMGGHDVFMARMDRTDSSFRFSQNLGMPVNSTSDDLQFVMVADGKTAFMSSARLEGMGQRDIYQVTPALPGTLAPVYLARGRVTIDGKISSAIIEVETITDGKKPYTMLYTDTVSGAYTVVLREGELYRLGCRASDLPVKTLTIDTRGLSAYTEKTLDFNLFAAPSPTVDVPVLAGTTPSAEVATAGPVSHTVVAWPDKDGFVPKTLLQQKAMRYRERYGNVSAPGLEFYVQFAALKGQGNLYFPKLSRHGKVARLRLGDGYTRLTLGGSFKTLNKAFAMNKKAIRAGQEEAFVIVLYKGERVRLEDLEKIGVFR